MFLSWRSDKEEDYNSLIAKKNYSRAIQLLNAQLQKDPKNSFLRQQLAEVFALSGKTSDAVRVLDRLADDFAREGFVAKSIAVLKKIQRLDPSHKEAEAKLAKLVSAREQEELRRQTRKAVYVSKEKEREEILKKISTGESIVHEDEPQPIEQSDDDPELEQAPPVSARPPAEVPAEVDVPDIEIEMEVETPETKQSVVASPLFGDFSHDELLAVIQGLNLLSFEPGDIIVSEGAPGDSLFILTTGRVKAFVKNRVGQYKKVRELGEGDFFGEISILTGKPRTATVTAVTECELLELDKAALETITEQHPRVRQVLQEFCDMRANSSAETQVRATTT